MFAKGCGDKIGRRMDRIGQRFCDDCPILRLRKEVAGRLAVAPVRYKMPEEAVQSAGLRFGEGDGSGSPLAPHVIVGHVDIASAGVRALLILRETLWRWAGPDRIASTAGAVWAAADEEGADGSAAPCPPAWGCGGDQVAPRAAPLQVDTFHGADGKPVLSVVCINAQFPSRSANAIALDLVRKVIADKVNPCLRPAPSCALA